MSLGVLPGRRLLGKRVSLHRISLLGIIFCRLGTSSFVILLIDSMRALAKAASL